MLIHTYRPSLGHPMPLAGDGMGHAFLNFRSAASAYKFQVKWHGQVPTAFDKWKGFGSRRLDVAFRTLAGL